MTLVAMATRVSTRRKRVVSDVSARMSARMPRDTKKIEAKTIWKYSAPSWTPLLCRSSTRAKATPARNAPMMPDRPTRSASIAYRNATIMAKMKTNSGYFRARGVASIRSMTFRMPKYPTAPATTMNPTALASIRTVGVNETSPLTTRSVETASTRRERTSSMTAAPMIARAASVWSTPISLRTFAVMAILVAVRAVPTKIALAKSNPKRTAVA